MKICLTSDSDYKNLFLIAAQTVKNISKWFKNSATNLDHSITIKPFTIV
jgi:hypothetical protein